MNIISRLFRCCGLTREGGLFVGPDVVATAPGALFGVVLPRVASAESVAAPTSVANCANVPADPAAEPSPRSMEAEVMRSKVRHFSREVFGDSES